MQPRNRALWGVLFLLLTLAAGYKLRRASEGMRGFYLWKQISGKAHQGRYVTSDGTQIYFETFGSGEPVLVLHGGGPGCLEAMQRQIRALADKYFVIAPDSRALKLSVGDYRYLQAVLEYPHAHRRRAPIIS